MNRGYVLVVDDDRLLAELAVAVLRGAGYEAVIADEGRSALALIGEHVPDAILLDANMPMLSGFEVLKTLNADPVLKRIPILMMTAQRALSDVIKAKQLGVFGYIAKPFAPDYLLRCIAAAIKSQPSWQSSIVLATSPQAPGVNGPSPDDEFID